MIGKNKQGKGEGVAEKEDKAEIDSKR